MTPTAPKGEMQSELISTQRNGGARVSSGRGSRQDYGTPWEFTRAVEARFGRIECDLAAHADNTKCPLNYLTEEEDSLSVPWRNILNRGGILWLNPPFNNIKPWAQKCLEESRLGARIAFLTTASVDTIWWKNYVHGHAWVEFLSPRLQFDGADDPFMKPLSLSLFNVRHRLRHLEVAAMKPLTILQGDCLPVLDACCGSRMFWFDRQDDRAVFVDKRREKHQLTDSSSVGGSRSLVIDPDIQADFTALPFEANSFALVVFDPPHLVKSGRKSWLAKKYGKLEANWRDDLRGGFSECFRVLRPEGCLIFKWNEREIPVSQILALTPERPLFGNRCGRHSKSHWIVFMKPLSPPSKNRSAKQSVAPLAGC